MRVHHLDCGTMCPVARRLINGDGSVLERGTLPCHCLLLETDAHGLILVDTGFGTADLADPAGRLGSSRHLLSWNGDPEGTAIARVRALGFAPEDVRHILVTHLDLDHAGGLSDFPHARVHLMATEQQAALAPPTRMEKQRYRSAHWAHGPDWRTYAPKGETWKGFEAVRALDGLPPEILLVPLAGHSRGHAGIAVDHGAGWLLHAGDAYFFRGRLAERPWAPPGIALFENLVAFDRPQMIANRERLRELRARESDVRVFCAHDPVELASLQG
ncbi:MAG: MBL fold metallo-hydrolase [Sandaracinus sp.]|nr:MBL fold metallo-hydrolase [Sandaracinus sp.]MCB9622354.1 MBL fold metallo-hydrolase [Sandaracinus sp.]MCB9636444.1 MBL fold metallo-hydrolase [Sandaracinus sp.]